MEALARKTCPKCGKTFEDAGLAFCLDDGARLVGPGEPLGETQPPVHAQTSSIVETSPAMAAVAPNVTNVNFPARMDPLEEGAQVGEYVVGRKIGEGGMGMIFSGVHPVIGKKVALKVLNLEMASNPEIVQRFILEAKAVNQIGHRNIVDIFSFGRLADGRHYFAMEFLEGQSLASRLASEVSVPWDTAIQVWIQIASAIEAAHGKGIIHRDLKPDNVYITPSAEGPYVKVLDFGIAKLLGDTPGLSKTSTGVPIGTPAYMSPEQASGAKIDARTDLYAYGIILYETIAGRPPFWHHNSFVALLTAHLNEAPPSLTQYVDIHADLNALVEKLLAKDPAQRPADMAEVRTELIRLRDLALIERSPLYAPKGQLESIKARLASEKPTAVRPIASTAAPKSRAGLFAGLGVAVLAVGGGMAFVATSKSDKPAPVAAVPAPPPPVAAAPAPAPSAPSIPLDTGRVVVSTNVIGARIYVDTSETEKSATPVSSGGMLQKFNVKAGVDLWLRVEADGYKPTVMPLRVNGGEETQLPVALATVEQPKPAPVVHHGGGGKRHGTAPAGAAPAAAPKPAAETKATNSNLMGFD